MSKELISKKDLLALTGISYGQLYRWKRKGLIPERWFIRKSTYTGQETFFPKEMILERIEKIRHLKEDISLDELAELFSPHPVRDTFSSEELLRRNTVTPMVLDFFVQQQGKTPPWIFSQALYMHVLEQLFTTGEISREEGAMVLQLLTEHYPAFSEQSCDLIFLRKMGIATCCLAPTATPITFEKSARVIFRLNLAQHVEILKGKLV